MIVLLVKAVVSPHTPFPAYIAVSFQAFLAVALFRLFNINLFSIFCLSILAMLESAVQKLVILTLFFGHSFWKATDELVRFISNQFSMPINHGSQWISVFYLLIYLIGGVLTAFMTYRLIKTFSIQNKLAPAAFESTAIASFPRNKNNRKKTIFVLLFVSGVLSLVLFLFTPKEQNRFVTLNAFTWTLTAILIWYIILAPLFAKVIRHILNKQTDRYSRQVENVLSFLPVLNQLAAEAWRNSKTSPAVKRIPVFITTLLSWSLLYTEPEPKS